ncbi:MAG: lamin tail domain-containing protein [bacterium]|nr:lamin tail domain-containing protein [bacterium]
MKYFLPSIFLAIFLGGLFGLPKTQSALSDEEKVENNVLSVATTFITITPTPTTEPTPTITPTPTPGYLADHIVISEVQITGGSGNTNNDFIELYNPTVSSVNLNGYRLVRRTGSSPNDTSVFVFNSSHSIPAHGFFLWANSGFASSIGADVSTTDVLAASNSIALRLGSLDTGTIIDALSWNSASQSLKEGTEFSPDPGANQSMERKAYSTSDSISMTSGSDVLKGNSYDSENNINDFVLRTPSQPQNTLSTTEIP